MIDYEKLMAVIREKRIEVSSGERKIENSCPERAYIIALNEIASVMDELRLVWSTGE
jgi:hypothetical protein